MKNHKATKLAFNVAGAIIGTSAKRHLMAFRRWADDDPLIVVIRIHPTFINNNNKKVVRVGPSEKNSGSAHAGSLFLSWKPGFNTNTTATSQPRFYAINRHGDKYQKTGPHAFSTARCSYFSETNALAWSGKNCILINRCSLVYTQ